MPTGGPAEIISADSRQVFRGLDIGTAKATAAERARRPAPRPRPRRSGRAVQRRRLRAPRARRARRDLGARGGVAILAGGTGLYLRAVARGLDTDALPSDPAVRARLEAELDARRRSSRSSRGCAALAPALAATDRPAQPAARRARARDRRAARRRAAPAARGYAGPVAWLGLDGRAGRRTAAGSPTGPGPSSMPA